MCTTVNGWMKYVNKYHTGAVINTNGITLMVYQSLANKCDKIIPDQLYLLLNWMSALRD